MRRFRSSLQAGWMAGGAPSGAGAQAACYAPHTLGRLPGLLLVRRRCWRCDRAIPDNANRGAGRAMAMGAAHRHMGAQMHGGCQRATAAIAVPRDCAHKPGIAARSLQASQHRCPPPDRGGAERHYAGRRPPAASRRPGRWPGASPAQQQAPGRAGAGWQLGALAPLATLSAPLLIDPPCWHTPDAAAAGRDGQRQRSGGHQRAQRGPGARRGACA